MEVNKKTKDEIYDKLDRIDKRLAKTDDGLEAETGIALAGVICEKCETHFFTSCETGKHQCPECNHEVELIFIPDNCAFAEKMEEIVEKIMNPGKCACPLCGTHLSVKKADENGCKFACKCGYYVGFDYEEEGTEDEN